MNSKLIIPETISVGFQKRNDTYTNKLAYVIYTDGKGVLRKEKSWQSWRDKSIEPEMYINTPVSGFVLNKKVGGNKYSWNPRNTYVRVFDPRGFEFEISVPNLLFILQECSSFKGKGLEGEFVYSWDGTELVLLPASSQEYKESANFTSLQTKKVKASDVKQGMIFVNKQNERVMYLGKHNWMEKNYDYPDRFTLEYTINNSKSYHIFLNLETNGYWLRTGFSALATIESSDISPLYAEKYEELINKCPNIGKEFHLSTSEYKVDKSHFEKYTYYNRKHIVGNDMYTIHKSYRLDNVYEVKVFKDAYTIVKDGKQLTCTSGIGLVKEFQMSTSEILEMAFTKYDFVNSNNMQTIYSIGD